MACPAVGIVGGGEASTAAQPATGGRSMRHDSRCFRRLEQQDHRLKKYYGRWMDIVWSMELESFILTKLTKPSVPPQVILPLWWVPASRGGIHFVVRNKEALPCVRRYSWWVRHVSRGTFFREIQRPFLWVLAIRWRNHYFARKRRHFLACGRGLITHKCRGSQQLSWVKYSNQIY